MVQKRLGHKNITITLETYSHFVPELDEEAAEKLNNALDIQGDEETAAVDIDADVLEEGLGLDDDA